jgi:hypothetical protein
MSRRPGRALAHFKPWPRPITITLYSKGMFAMVHRSDQYINDSHSPRRRLYEPEARAGFSSLQTFGLQLIRASVQIKIRHRIYELEH